MNRQLFRFATALLLLGLVCLKQSRAQLTLTGIGGGFSGGFTPSCTQSGNFITRAVAAFPSYNTTHKTAVDALICGLVNQSSTISGTLFSRLDAFYALRTQDVSVAVLNLVQNAFNLTASGTITFTADAGVTSNGTTGFYNTGFNPTAAAGQMAQNSAHISFCSTQVGSGAGVPIGGTDGTQFVEALDGGASYLFLLNNASNAPSTDHNAASFMGSRTSSTLQTTYENAVSSNTNATATTALVNANIFILARNNGGADQFTSIQFAYASIGAAYSATDVTNFRNLITAYMAAVGGAAC